MAGAIISTVSVHWGTPGSLLDRVRQAFEGPIDLDPCGNAASTERVNAKTQIWLPDEADRYMDTPNPGPHTVDGNPYSTLPIELPKNVAIGDGLKAEWTLHNNVFCNPPYGKDVERGTSIYDWIEKASWVGRTVPTIMLIPAAVGTSHWQDIIFQTATAICFLRGRVKFLLEGKDNVSTTPSSMVLWSNAGNAKFAFDEAFRDLGKVITP